MNLVLFLAMMLSPTKGFSVRNLKVLKTTPRTNSLLLRQEKITWSDYKHDFIDPIAAHAADKTKLEHWLLEDRTDPRIQDSAEGYWLEQFEADKERLQNMNQAASSTPETSIPPPTSTWDQYSRRYIDPILRKKNKKDPNLHGRTMDPETKASANEFWSKTVLADDEKETVQNMNQAASSTPETSIPPGFPIWDQYNHKYIDPISSSSKTDTMNLQGQQMEPETARASVVDETLSWLKTLLDIMDEEKEKLQNMNQAASSIPETSIPPPTSTWDQYHHKFIDSISRQHGGQQMDPETWASVDEYGLKTDGLDETKKVQNMDQAASSTPETSIPPGFPIWDQYTHKYIDSSISTHREVPTTDLQNGRQMDDPETWVIVADDLWC